MDHWEALASLLRGEPVPVDADLVQAAAAHGVLGLLEQQLLRAEPALTKRLLTEQRLSQMRVVAVEREVLAALPRGCQAVLIKGPALSERLYGDAFRRSSRDLDLLIAPEDLDSCVGALQGLGFAVEAAESERYHRAHHHHLTLVRPLTPPVELHFRLLAGFGTSLPAAVFFDRSVPYRSDAIRVLSREDEFLYLAVHAAQHLCNRLIWLEDLRRLAAGKSRIDMAAVRERATQWRVRQALEFTLRVLDGESKRWLLFRRLEASNLPLAVREVCCQAMICDSGGLAWQHLSHHVGRMLKRRTLRVFPSLGPKSWAD